MNTFATIVKGWVDKAFPAWKQLGRERDDGEFELAFPSPAGSKAGHLVIFTSQGNAWVRFSPPRMCYCVEDRKEMSLVVKHLLSDAALFVTIFRGRKWTGTTLVRPGTKPDLEPGEVATIVSWSGNHDESIRRSTRVSDVANN